MARLLIFSGYNDRAVVALCRELTALDEPFSIIAASETDPIFHTAYRAQVAAVRRVKSLQPEDIDRCLTELQALHPSHRYVIAPSSEFLDQHVLRHREWFAERRCTIPLVDAACYAKVTNKWSFRTLCETAGITVPALVDLSTGRFPFVAKPRVNITADGRSLYPVLVHSADDWTPERRALCTADDYYFEELIDGPSYYLLYYLPADQRAPIFAWSQRNLLQQPGGKSMLFAQSDTLHTAPISRRMTGMLTEAGFHGLAMIELIRRGDDYLAIELNPRLWGPMQLVRNAGSDLIRAFIEDALYGSVQVADPTAGHPASYVWLGGMSNGMVWHGPKTRWSWLSLTTGLADDVYLRADTLGLFVNEWVRKP